MDLRLNGENLTLILVALQAAWTAFREIAPRTQTKRDDALVAMVDSRMRVIREKASYLWAVVEVMARSGVLPDKAAKATEFVRRLQTTMGHLTDLERAEAERIAANLSADEKLTRKP